MVSKSRLLDVLCQKTKAYLTEVSSATDTGKYAEACLAIYSVAKHLEIETELKERILEMRWDDPQREFISLKFL